jgi:ubiquinone/menaquinone biosynthesis C-methylase UbiE
MQLEEVPLNYDRAARWYDRLTDIVFGSILGLENYRERAIDLLGSLAGATVLDVGCGTGRNFPLLVQRVGEHGRIIGLDYSEGMLEQARRRSKAHGWRNVELVRGDAATLDGIPEPVDAVISVWCYGIVYDLEAALNRAIDVLRPGGRIAIMDFQGSRPDHGPLRWLYPLYSTALRWAGIDTAEDLDDAKLRAKWKRGRHVLSTRLRDLTQDTYQQGAGIIIAGKKPVTSPVAGKAG